MPEASANINTFRNLSVLETKMPFDLFERLSTAIDNISAETGKKFNSNLLGHMQEEYSLNHIKETMSEYLESSAHLWTEQNPGFIESFEEVAKADTYTLYLDSIWVNKQQKYEFNPVHHHGGVLSFVIWIKVPYDLKEEEAYFPRVSGETEDGPHNQTYTSKFTFYYNDVLGGLQPAAVPVDKSYEGTMLMFPAGLHHAVYPFYTSDDYRISVSGNIRIRPVYPTSDDRISELK